jgi:hypothetical protein
MKRANGASTNPSSLPDRNPAPKPRHVARHQGAI